MCTPSRADAGWAAALAIGTLAEQTAKLDEARGLVHAIARSLRSADARVSRRATSPFSDYARDAAAAFGHAEAADQVSAILDALIEGITQIREEAAPAAARAALAYALDLGAALPFEDESWRAAMHAIGRGIRETAIGQQLERYAVADFDSFWTMVDRKTPPLVATALELGALAAGADPARASALTRLARPLGRLLQIGDDCRDALGEEATDWRTPHLNLLMLYSLCGPNGSELAPLLRPERMHEARLWLLRDGALTYAIHAQTVTLDELSATLKSLELPNPAPFVRWMERQHEESAQLLLKMSAAT